MHGSQSKNVMILSAYLIDVWIFFILQSGITSLNEACCYGNSETVNLLLKAGAKIDILDEVHDNHVLCSCRSIIINFC